MKNVPLNGILPAKNEKQKADDQCIQLTSSNPPQSGSNQQPATTPNIKNPPIRTVYFSMRWEAQPDFTSILVDSYFFLPAVILFIHILIVF